MSERMSVAAATERVRAAFPEIDAIQDRALHAAVADIWTTAWLSSAWIHLHDCPTSSLLPQRSLVAHTRAVAASAVALSGGYRGRGASVDSDSLLTIALLHDVSKLHELEPSPEGATQSLAGRRYPHGFLAGAWMLQHQLSAQLVHAVVTHTDLSGVAPDTLEGVIVHYADFLDADIHLLEAGQRLLCDPRR